jgi:hypothetical protein
MQQFFEMKTTTLVARLTVIATILLPVMLPAAIPGFNEDFESGLGQWTGRAGGSHNGQIVADPLASGNGSVLNFTSTTSGGDMFASSAITLPGPIEISFDYLGLPALGGVPDDLGGFLGIAYSLTPVADGVDIFWYAGTQHYPGLAVELVDDGLWHRYSFLLDGSALLPFHLILEDFTGSGGVAGDAHFDNITVTPVPEPTTFSLAALATLLAARRNRCG